MGIFFKNRAEKLDDLRRRTMLYWPGAFSDKRREYGIEKVGDDRYLLKTWVADLLWYSGGGDHLLISGPETIQEVDGIRAHAIMNYIREVQSKPNFRGFDCDENSFSSFPKR
jgi:hypothetical protein